MTPEQRSNLSNRRCDWTEFDQAAVDAKRALEDYLDALAVKHCVPVSEIIKEAIELKILPPDYRDR